MSYLGLSGNSDLMKRLNLEKVMRTILLHRPISRAQIASLTGLNKVTVSNCVEYFLEQRIICELGTTGTSRGRPPTLIDINGQSGVMLGLDVDIYMVRMLVTDLAGKKLESRTLPLHGKEPELFLETVKETVRSVRARYGHFPLSIVGMGLALPGHYNYQSGFIEFVANLKTWNGFPIREELEKLHLGFPIYIDTIANAGAMGEIHFGKSGVAQTLVYLNGFWGLGVGIYSNGKIFSGHNGFAGRLGHSTIHMNGKKCTCGNRGCWEAYASVRALYEQLYPDKHITVDSFEEVISRLQKHDPEVVSAIHELTRYLALGLVNVINAYNPSEICIGGYLGLLDPHMGERIKRMLEESLPMHFLRGLTINISELGELAVAYGAISMVRENISSLFAAAGQESI